jgi:hypothetical protein
VDQIRCTDSIIELFGDLVSIEERMYRKIMLATIILLRGGMYSSFNNKITRRLFAVRLLICFCMVVKSLAHTKTSTKNLINVKKKLANTNRETGLCGFWV